MTTPVCTDELRKIYDAIMELATGQQAVSISFNERTVSYSQAQLKDLQGIYRAFYRQCGCESGLPDLSTTTQRGAPARMRY